MRLLLTRFCKRVKLIFPRFGGSSPKSGQGHTENPGNLLGRFSKTVEFDCLFITYRALRPSGSLHAFHMNWYLRKRYYRLDQIIHITVSQVAGLINKDSLIYE
jgi:hypothetical protein